MEKQATPWWDATMRLCPSETLRAARVLITDVRVWSQHARARNSRGRKCDPNDPDAVQWSMTGAIAVVSNRHGVTPPFLLKRLDRMVVELGLVRRLFPVAGDEWEAGCFPIWESCDDFNDFRTHADVLELLDAAAAELREEGY
jgi:hypothetical protein